MLTGGGSGGHITPLLAIAAELKRLRPKTHIIYIGQRGDNLVDIPTEDAHIDDVFLVRAGKLRRYYGEGFRQLLDISTFLKNLRDFGYVLIGIRQSRSLLKKLQPDIIFIKGGFIGVPVGLAAASLNIPYITHDSDAMPGLANRIISRWASLHAVALPGKIYNYPAKKTVTTGIPLRADFVPITDKLKKNYRQEIQIPDSAKMLFVIGGGLGAQRINSWVAEAMPHILHEFSDLYIVHVAGRANKAGMKKLYNNILTPGEEGRVRIFGYLPDVYLYSGAADVIVTRAGATNLAEFALQGKACVVIPSPFLSGGHQIKNARYLFDNKAIQLLDESDISADTNRLAKQVSALLNNKSQQKELANNLAKFAKPDATQEIAELLLAHVQEESAGSNKTKTI